MQKRHSALYLFGCAGIISLIGSGAAAQYKVPSPGSVIDLSPTVSMSLKQNWPGGQRHHQPVIFPLCPARSERVHSGSDHRRQRHGDGIPLPAAHDGRPGHRTAELRLLGLHDVRQGAGVADGRAGGQGRRPLWHLRPGARGPKPGLHGPDGRADREGAWSRTPPRRRSALLEPLQRHPRRARRGPELLQIRRAGR